MKQFTTDELNTLAVAYAQDIAPSITHKDEARLKHALDKLREIGSEARRRIIMGETT